MGTRVLVEYPKSGICTLGNLACDGDEMSTQRSGNGMRELLTDSLFWLYDITSNTKVSALR